MISLEKLKKIIVESREYIETVELIPRDTIIEKNANYVFTGQRRAGKTFFLYQLIKQHPEKDYLFINFEDERLIEFSVSDFDNLLQAHFQLYGGKPIVYFDEVQNIIGWEKFCRRIADQGYQLFITGSNAMMLSSEIATILGGRFLTHEIQPLSFSEYLHFNKVTLKNDFAYSKQKNELLSLQDSYLYFGGLPECIHYADKRNYLSNIYQKVFFGDILARHKLKNDFALKLLIKKMAESVNNETSFTRLRNIIQSANIKVGTSTLIEYSGYLEESFLVFNISNFTAKFAEKESKKKFYFSDTGILNLFLFDQKTKLLENMIYLELRRRYAEPLYYYKRNLELDFYLPEKELLIQSCYSMAEYDTRQREIKAVLAAMKELRINKATIITIDEDEEVNVNGHQINIIPFWKWALSNSF